MSIQRNYWGFRIDTNCREYPDYYKKELDREVLRQGWGYEDEHNLKLLSKANTLVPIDQVANLRMYNGVKRGDIILIPRIPNCNFVTIAQATSDWDTGYKFEIDKNMRDYGHQFPAKYLNHFSRDNKHVLSDVVSTLKARQRFWRLSASPDSIEALRRRETSELIDNVESEDRFNETVLSVMNQIRVEDEIHKKLLEQFGGSAWEYALVTGLKALFPFYDIERTGGSNESKHGTDILITMPGPLENVRYGIAVQVKDWREKAWDIASAISQIEKADKAWKELHPELNIVEKIIVLTNVPSAQENLPKESHVTIMNCHELKKLLRRMALAMATKSDE